MVESRDRLLLEGTSMAMTDAWRPTAALAMGILSGTAWAAAAGPAMMEAAPSEPAARVRPTPTTQAGGGRYEANWASLDSRPMPPWFAEARFGVFICWGPYSVPAWAPKGQYAEWYGFQMRKAGSPTAKFHERVYGSVEEFRYERFAPMLTGEMWDPDQWADLFARAGARYVVLAANYHDGFCLWPSSYSKGWNSADVGPKRDVLGELSAAVRKRGLKMGIYYSLYEWFHPLWLSDRKRYVAEHFHPQFKEVVTRYKPSLIFADGEWEADDKLWRSEELLAWLFNDSPVRDEVAVNDRWGNSRGRHGSFYESEYGGGNMSPKHPWQEDRGMGRSYGYNRNEGIFEYDSPADMIRMMTRCAGGGGNYLICVGPAADGRIPVIMQERLVQIGQWLAANGESIYGATASPFWPRRFAWGTVTAGPGRLYLHLWRRPGDALELPGLKNRATAAYWLTDKARRAAQTTAAQSGLRIALPERLPDEAASVLAMEIEGEPQVVRVLPRPQADGTLLLPATEADIHGTSPQLEGRSPRGNIGFWASPADWVSWTFELSRAGEYDVEIIYACAPGAAGSEFIIAVGGQDLPAKSESTGSWDRFERRQLGRVRFDKAGQYALTVRPRPKPPWKAISLESVMLHP